MFLVEFSRDATPGARYKNQATQGAIKFQSLWGKFWGSAKQRKNKSVTRIQTAFRRYSAMKRICPLIRIRRHFSKKAYFVFCFSRWKEYLVLLSRMKSYITLWSFNYVPICFDAWKKWLTELKEQRDSKKLKFLTRSQNHSTVHTSRPFKRWIRFTENNVKAKKFLKRMLLCPYPQVNFFYFCYFCYLPFICSIITCNSLIYFSLFIYIILTYISYFFVLV